MKKNLLALALLAFLPSILLSQPYWQKTDIGGEGGIIYSYYADSVNQILYAGTDGKGVFSTTNAGASWNDLSLALPSKAMNITSITKVGNDLIVGSFYFTTSEGIYKTSNNGASWQEITGSLTGSSRKINEVFYQNSKLYIGTEAGIFVSEYPAISWVNISSNIGSARVTNIYSTDNLLFVTTGSGVFKSSNNGQNWIAAGSGLPSTGGKSFLKFNSALYTTASGTGVYVSTNFGDTWTTFNTNLSSGGENAWSLYRFNGNMYVSTNNGVYVLTGSSWTRVSNNLPASQNFCYAMSSIGGKLFTSSYSRGTYSTTDPAVTWTQSVNGLRGNILQAQNAVLLNGVYYVGTSAGVFSSANCINWIKSNGDLPSPAYAVNKIYTFSTELYIATNSGLYRSTNAGVNWINMNGDITSNFNFYTFYKDVSKIYTGTRNGLFYSTNNGVNWLPTEVNTTNNPVECVTKYNGILFAGRTVANAPTLWRSTNDGTNWSSAVFSGIGAAPEVFNFFADGSVLYLTTGGGVYRSSNNGTNWRNVNHGLPSDPYISSMIKIGTSYFCSLLFGGGGVSRTSGNDSTWGDVNLTGNPIGDYNSVLQVDNKIFAFMNAGIYYTDVSTITGLNSDPAVFSPSYLLLKNYPNPFNPQTKISFNVINAGQVSLNVYDINGRSVQELINETRTPGNYEITFDGSRLNSGVYFVKLVNGTNSITSKVVLLK